MFSPYFGGVSICSLKFDMNGLGSFRFLQIAPQITPHGSRKSVYLADEENAEMKNAGTCRQTRTQPVPGKKRCTQCTATHSPEISFGYKKKSQSPKMKSVTFLRFFGSHSSAARAKREKGNPYYEHLNLFENYIKLLLENFFLLL